MKTEKEIFDIKTEYYNNDVMINKIINYIHPIENEYREVSILSNNNLNKTAFRCLTFSTIDFFREMFLNKDYPNTFLNNDSNIYCSVARLSRIPVFPFGKDRNKYTLDFYKNQYKDFIKHYDIFLDFDIDITKKKEFKDLFKDLDTIILLIQKYKLKSEIVFSGNRGFKVVLFNDYYNVFDSINIRRNIISNFNFKTLDNSGYFVISKLMKVNYTLVFNTKNNFIGIAQPIDLNLYSSIKNNCLLDYNFNIFNYKNNIFSSLQPIYIFDTLNNNNNLIEFVEQNNLLKVLK